MAHTIIDGKATAAEIRKEIAEEVSLKTSGGLRPPGLAVVIVGDDPASRTYVRNKDKAAHEVGFHSRLIDLPEDTSQEKLMEQVNALNDDPAIDGILCQLPLPKALDEQAVILGIDPDKDVDGFHPVNVGRLTTIEPGFVSCTPLGCIELLLRYNIETSGAHAVVIGRSHMVGNPMARLLSSTRAGGNATVTQCHSRTKDLAGLCRQADIIVAAVGKPNLVTVDMVKDGAVVIDVGVNSIEDSSRKSGRRLVGDVDFENVAPKCKAITPVPGGVGPMTIAMLLKNTLDSWKRREKLS